MSGAHGQELRPEDTAPFREVVRDLVYLAGQDALAGVAEVIRERRKQIEQAGRTVEKDRAERSDGWLMTAAYTEAWRARAWVQEGIDGPAETSVLLASSAALAAAEVDRLQEFFS